MGFSVQGRDRSDTSRMEGRSTIFSLVHDKTLPKIEERRDLSEVVYNVNK